MHQSKRYNLGRYMLPQRWVLVAMCLPLVLLAGCPQSQSASPGRALANETAPTATKAVAANSAQAAQASTTTAQSVENAAKAYKAQELINKAEQSYRSGVDNYRAGR